MAIPDLEDLGPWANLSSWVLFGITAVFASLRIWCRLCYGSRRLFLDDWITLFCLAIYLFSCVLQTVAISYGLGAHFDTLSAHNQKMALFWNVFQSSIVIWVFSLPKLAMVAVLCRILRNAERSKTFTMFWALALLSQAGIFAVSVLWWEECTPIAYQWDRSIEGGSCPRLTAIEYMGYVTSAYSSFLDLFYAVYPLPAIMRLQLPLKNRLAISTAMGLTAIGFVVSIYKIVELTNVLPMLPDDPTYPMPYVYVLVYAEATVLLTCACIPALSPIFQVVRAQVRTGRSSDKSGSNGKRHGKSSRSLKTLVTIGGGVWGGASGRSRFKKSGTQLDDEEAIEMDGPGSTSASYHDASASRASTTDDVPLVTSMRAADAIGAGGSGAPVDPSTISSTSDQTSTGHEPQRVLPRGGIRKTVDVSIDSKRAGPKEEAVMQQAKMLQVPGLL